MDQYADESANWTAATATPGAANAGLRYADATSTTTLRLYFSEALTSATATTVANYTLSGVTDLARPRALITAVTDPQTGALSAITITFSKPVTGFALDDLTLTCNGGANLLTSSQTLTTTDSRTWTLGNLSPLTAANGNYLLTLAAADSTIVDPSGNSLLGNATERWSANGDDTVPTVTIEAVATPRNSAVSTLAFVFSEAVNGFGLADLTLACSGGSNLLTSSQTLTTSDHVTWPLSDLSGLTATAGSYTLTLVADGAGIQDAAGNLLASDASVSWKVVFCDLDADGNGTADALTDGLLILRYLFDPTGSWNYSDALGSGATRTTRAAIKAYMDQYNPAVGSSAVATTNTATDVSAEETLAASTANDTNAEETVADVAEVTTSQSVTVSVFAGADETSTPETDATLVTVTMVAATLATPPPSESLSATAVDAEVAVSVVAAESISAIVTEEAGVSNEEPVVEQTSADRLRADGVREVDAVSAGWEAASGTGTAATGGFSTAARSVAAWTAAQQARDDEWDVFAAATEARPRGTATGVARAGVRTSGRR